MPAFLFGCAVACAWLGERSEPTCIKTSTRLGAKIISIAKKILKYIKKFLKKTINRDIMVYHKKEVDYVNKL